ncbi:SURF1 family cytochrome oxidase biogenesis protein [Variovorax dokdonensis]|uniref:SURF1-like protein n=1 Tax=Variovorax dokdonensis TaxID=344883 RepID=A0ABT7N5H0_9BURK|nr:SURF1 family cytochrome oxidase biogenesis protein [Variovorax dokdonensis]MDM0043183.1 SURF1 family cytochrome oxidase biogenesis protein [Variovorax dokdonensis]
MAPLSPSPRRSWRWLILLLALALVATGILLGRWQLNRASQKEAIQAQIAAQGKLEPLTQAQFLAMDDPLASVHRRVKLRGLWLVPQTVYLDNRQMNGVPGFFVLTPFALEGTEQTVMIQRGWIQRNFEDRISLQPVQTPPGLVEVEAVIATPPAHLLELGSPASSEPGSSSAIPAPAATQAAPSTSPAQTAPSATSAPKTTTDVQIDPPTDKSVTDIPIAPRLVPTPADPEPASQPPASSVATTPLPSKALQAQASRDKAAPDKPLQGDEARNAVSVRNGTAGPSPSAIRQNLDLDAYRRETGLPLRTGFSLQQVGPASEGLKRDWPAPALGIDRHYGYAFQWFCLSAVVAILYVWFQLIAPFRRTRRARRLHG